MKKLKFMKRAVTVLVTVCIVASQTFRAFGYTILRTADDNTDFAIKSAEIVYLYDSKKSRTQADSTGEILRIIGRASDDDYCFTGFGASAAVVSDDGRFLLQFKDKSAFDKCFEYLNSDPDIIYAEKDSLVYTCASDGGSAENLSWGVDTIKVSEYAENIQNKNNGNVTVAIVDSGVAEIDFVADKLVEGYDFIKNEKGGAIDESADSHGTFLASIVADCVKDAAVNIMPVRVLASKTGSLVNAVNGIYYAADNGADIINVSLGGVLNNCKSFDDALAYAESKNVSVVVCAGNLKCDIENYCPAHNESAITVTAVDENLDFADDFMPNGNSGYGSNYGEAVDVCAPGVNIIGYGSDGNLKTLSGTSMSAAFVSACAALFRLDNPECNTAQVQQAIKNSCTDLGASGFDIYYGFGLPDMSTFINSSTDEPYIVGVRIASLPDKTVYTYKIDETLSLSGIVLEAKYSDGSKKNITDISKMTASGYSPSSAGEQTVTVEYEGFTVQYEVRVEYVWWQWIIRILLLGFLWY